MLFLETVPSDTMTLGGKILENLPDIDPYDLGEYVEQLREIGYIEGRVHFYGRNNSQPRIIVHRVTTAGHDFIQTIREDSVWRKVTAEVIQTGKAWTIQMLYDYAKMLASHHLGLPSSS